MINMCLNIIYSLQVKHGKWNSKSISAALKNTSKIRVSNFKSTTIQTNLIVEGYKLSRDVKELWKMKSGDLAK